MKTWFLMFAVLSLVLCGAPKSAQAAGRFVDEQAMPPFYEPTGVHHFRGTVLLGDDEVPVNDAFGTQYTDCKARESGAGWLDPQCAALFADLGFYLLHTAYFWQADRGYVPAASHPSVDYSVESASLSYDANSRAVTYDLALRYAWTCRGLGCQYAPVVVASLFTNLVDVDDDDLSVYDDALAFGPSNYLLTGDGQERHTSADFASSTAFSGASAIEVRTSHDSGTGSHWKLMLFASGSAAGNAGVDLTGYSTLEFMVRTNRSQGVFLQGAFGTGDDSANRGLGAFFVSPQWQKVSLDLSGLNLSDVNTFLWVYLHKSLNPFDFTGTAVYIDDVRLLP